MTEELASRDLCVPVYMKKKTNVSVQTSANVTWNPLAISMVTNTQTVQRGSQVQVLYRYKMTQKKKERGRAEMMCSTINSVFPFFFT